MHAVVIYNPISGVGRAVAASETAAARLRAAGYSVERIATLPESGARAIAAAVGDRAQLVVVAGGDGSLRETLEALGDTATRVPIALVPLGNANVIARELGVPLDTNAAIEALTGDHTSALDVGEVTLRGRAGAGHRALFLGMVGIGWDASIVRRIDHIRRSKLGRRWYGWWADSVYFFAGSLAAFRRQPRDLQLTVDGVPVRQAFRAALLCNTRTYGKGWSMTPEACACDGRLDYQARKRSSLPWLLWHLLAAVFGRRCPAYVSEYGRGERLRIRAERALPVQVDGDDRGDALEIEVALRPRSVRIVTPR